MAKESDDNASEKGGPVMVSKRKCRDIPFLVVFLLVWVAMAIIAASGIKNGNPQLLIVPQDSYGNYCGYNNPSLNNSYSDQSANKYLYYFDPIALQTGTYICVSSCPTETKVLTDYTKPLCRYDTTANVTFSNYATLIYNGLCATYTYSSSPILNRCAPIDSLISILSAVNSTSSSTGATSTDFVTAGSTTTMTVLSGLVQTWPVIVAGIGGSVIVSLIWMGLLQFTAGIFVWVTIILSNLAFAFASVWLYFFWKQSEAILNGTTYLPTNSAATSFMKVFGINSGTLATSSTVQMLQIAFYVFAVLTVLLILITIGMLKRVKMAVGVIKQASIAMMKMPLIVLFPLITFLLIALLFVYFVWILIYLITPTNAGPQTFSVASASWTDSNAQTAALAIHVFGFLYTLFFFSGINQVTIAGAIASWYWSYDKSQKMQFPVMKSFARTLRYHLGSIACGSLLIAIVEFIRVVLYQLQRKAQQSNLSALKYLVACLQCCMKCVSVIVKFINRNAYIVVAITGKAFFASAGHATGLLVKNALKLVAVDFVSSFVLLLSKVFVAAISAISVYLYITANSSMYAGVVYPQVSVAIVALGAFMVSSAFFSVYEMAIDTIFLSFLEDLERNDGSAQKPYFMPDALAKLMGVENSIQKSGRVAPSPSVAAASPSKPEASPSKAAATSPSKAAASPSKAASSPTKAAANRTDSVKKTGKVYNEF